MRACAGSPGPGVYSMQQSTDQAQATLRACWAAAWRASALLHNLASLHDHNCSQGSRGPAPDAGWVAIPGRQHRAGRQALERSRQADRGPAAGRRGSRAGRAGGRGRGLTASAGGDGALTVGHLNYGCTLQVALDHLQGGSDRLSGQATSGGGGEGGRCTSCARRLGIG